MLHADLNPILVAGKNDTTYRVETVDGNEYIGKIVGRDSSGIKLNTAQLAPSVSGLLISKISWCQFGQN
jgi:hypothetical protein